VVSVRLRRDTIARLLTVLRERGVSIRITDGWLRARARRRAAARPIRPRRRVPLAAVVAACAAVAAVCSQALAAPEWGAVATPSAPPARVIGRHSLGCLAGGLALPADGPGYRAVRLSRNRHYGHPDLVRFVAALGKQAREAGLGHVLVGDMAQPRGGPMSSGHRSHQTGLDVDIWFRTVPAATPLALAERESLPAWSMVAPDGTGVDRERWTPVQIGLLRAAAERAEVDRIFVHPAIKRELCTLPDAERGWLRKVRPWWGHDAHFHVRLRCPEGEEHCREQPPVPSGEGCDETLAWWFSPAATAAATAAPEIRPPDEPPLPAQCQWVLIEPATE
jgi:penicillin-insensitive murein DD-endopeptidase